MPLLHDLAQCGQIRERIHKLAPDSRPHWGSMSVDQMLWHVNRVLSNALDEFHPEPMHVPIPRGMAKFLTLNMPWPRNAPTQPLYAARDRYSFEDERRRCLTLIDVVASRELDTAPWGFSAAFGQMTGRDWSRLNAKHLNHHLKQFGV